MKRAESKRRIGSPSPAMVVAVIALIAALSGSAIAAIGNGPVTADRKQKTKKPSQPALARNSVGTRQLKSKAVTTGKLANNAVNGRKVARHSLTGEDINLGALGTVPSAANAANAGNADTVGGHGAVCPSGAVLLRGACFDSASSGPVGSVQSAADACAANGGFLPSPMELYSVRGVINLGTGVGSDYQYTDTFYANDSGGAYFTIVVDGKGALSQISSSSPARYICTYPLVR